ncbi:MAG TPA: flagellar motor switch protein FliN [Allosphingosinicella sp.]|jgi:flagellar motor switch protein FliN/FliY
MEKPQPDAAIEGRPPTPLLTADSDLLRDVEVTLQVRLGEARMTLDELLGLSEGAVLPLDRGLGELVGVYLNQRLIARGEIVAVGESFGLRIVEVASA